MPDFGERKMYKATCSDCGTECEVPFQPTNDRDGNARPVYCRECFKNHRKPRY